MNSRRSQPTAVAGLLLAVALAPTPGLAHSTADIRRIFTSWDEWQSAYGQLVAAMDAMESLIGEPIESPERLAAAVEARERVHRAARGPEGYLYLRLQLSGEDEEALSRQRLLDETDRRWYSKLSPWFERSVGELGRERVGEWVASHSPLGPYEFFLRRFFDRAAHSYPEGQEQLRTLAGLSRQQASRVYNAVAVAEAPEVQVTLASGERLEIRPAPARTVLGSLSDPVDRRLVARTWLEALGQRSQTYAALLEGIVRHEQLLAEVRGFESPLSARLHGDSIPADTVRNVIHAARQASAPLRRYHELRQRMLAIDDYGLADRFVLLGREPEREVDFEEAHRLIVEASSTLGPEVESLVRRAFSDGWIDSIERPGKRPNAGSTFVDGHPFVYLPYRGSIENVFQLAHEIGHAVHAYLAHQAQPYVYSHRSPLTSETVAGVFEGVLVHRMVARPTGRQGTIRVLDLSIQKLLRLFYRPMLDADFELRIYEADVPITGASLGELYLVVIAEYYGEAVRLHPWDAHGWQTTPHFFTSPLYLGRYGLASAAADLLLPRLTSPAAAEAAAARRDFLDLMRAGSSDYPLDLLRRAGVDLGRAGAGDGQGARLGSLVDELARAVDSN